MSLQSFRNKALIALFGILLMIPALANAADDITGWEVDSEYNELYDPKERDSIKGDILKFITTSVGSNSKDLEKSAIALSYSFCL